MEFTDILLNPVIVSVVCLCVLCVLKINVLFSLMISALVAGFLADISVSDIMNYFISGMGQNSETALSYILLGTLAVAMEHTGVSDILSNWISNFIKDNKYLLILILVLISIMSQNLIPVHIAFIPIVVPPLIGLMNKLKIDRRAIACSLAFGLKAPYIAFPLGFGLIFQGLIADNMTANGIKVLKNEIWHCSIFLGLAMFVALLVAIFITYRKPRVYSETTESINPFEKNMIKFNKKHFITLFGACATLFIQILTGSLPLGALIGLGIIFGFKAVSHKKMDILLNQGVSLMGYIAFVMLVCAGFAFVLKQTGGIEELISAVIPFIQDSKILATVIMLIIGLIITIGIGSSFGTIPILAVLFVPLCSKLGLSVSSSIIVLCAAAALGDAGSPASDTTLGPTAGLNVDNQHDHIKDTCIPTFIHFNTALIIAAIVAVCIFQ